MRSHASARSRRVRNRRSRVSRKRFTRTIPRGIAHFNRYETKAISEARAIQLIGGAGAAGFTTEALVPFRMANLVNSDDFRNLYNSYRLNKCVVEMVWSNEQAVQSAEISIDENNPPGTANQITTTRYDPLDAITCYYYNDYDGSPQLLADEDEFRERQGVKRFSMKKGKKYSFKLTPASRAVQWAAPPIPPSTDPVLGTSRAFKKWYGWDMTTISGLETDGGSIPHYGMVMGFAHPNPSATPGSPRYGVVEVTVKYYFSCKGVS